MNYESCILFSNWYILCFYITQFSNCFIIQCLYNLCTNCYSCSYILNDDSSLERAIRVLYILLQHIWEYFVNLPSSHLVDKEFEILSNKFYKPAHQCFWRLMTSLPQHYHPELKVYGKFYVLQQSLKINKTYG